MGMKWEEGVLEGPREIVENQGLILALLATFLAGSGCA